jgi:hypothetical protein
MMMSKSITNECIESVFSQNDKRTLPEGQMSINEMLEHLTPEEEDRFGSELNRATGHTTIAIVSLMKSQSDPTDLADMIREVKNSRLHLDKSLPIMEKLHRKFIKIQKRVQ